MKSMIHTPLVRKRLSAFAIDALLFWAALLVLRLLTQELWVLSTVGTALFKACFFARDGFTGRSFGRSRMGIQVIRNNGLPVNPWRALLRNLTTLLWPVELGLLLFTGQRLGDWLTDTTVIDAPQGGYVESDASNYNVILLATIAFMLPALLRYLSCPVLSELCGM